MHELFNENLYTYYPIAEDVPVEFIYWLDYFYFEGFMLFLDLVFFITRNTFSVLLRKNFDLNIKNVLLLLLFLLLLKWNFIFTIMINDIFKSCANFILWKKQRGGGVRVEYTLQV